MPDPNITINFTPSPPTTTPTTFSTAAGNSASLLVKTPTSYQFKEGRKPGGGNLSLTPASNNPQPDGLNHYTATLQAPSGGGTYAYSVTFKFPRPTEEDAKTREPIADDEKTASGSIEVSGGPTERPRLTGQRRGAARP